MFAVQAIGAATAAAGTAYGVTQSQSAAEASKKAERVRQEQMRMNVAQEQRKRIREFQLARAQSASNISSSTGTLENSAFGGSSSAYSASIGTNLGELATSERLGNDMFAANASYAQSSANAQAGSQVGSFGKDLFSSGPELSRIGATLFGSKPA